MIPFFGAYIKTIVSFLLISVLVEIITPEGYKKYLNLVMGIMLTMAVLNPIISFMGTNMDNLFGIIDKKTEEIWRGDGETVSSDYADILYMAIFKEQLEQSIRKDANAQNVEIFIDESDFDTIYEIKVYKQEDKNDEKTRDYLIGKYGITKDGIEFIYQ